jgi:hypothetical protein
MACTHQSARAWLHVLQQHLSFLRARPAFEGKFKEKRSAILGGGTGRGVGLVGRRAEKEWNLQGTTGSMMYPGTIIKGAVRVQVMGVLDLNGLSYSWPTG